MTSTVTDDYDGTATGGAASLEALPMVLRTDEAASIARCCRRTITRACGNGSIKAVRAGGNGSWCINRDSLLEYAGLI